jgi:2-haloacid dehalogenase
MLFIFDVNETLLDLEPFDAVFARHLGDGSLRTAWFDGLIHAALTITAAGEYEGFGQLAAASMRRVAEERNIDLADDAVTDLGTTLKSLPPHPEVPVALQSLRQADHRLVALANSPMATVEAQIRNAGLANVIEAVYSVEHARQLKPGRSAYTYVLEKEALDAADAVLVAAHDWDIAGAQAAGLRTAFISRGGRLPLIGRPAPSLVVRDLAELADRADTLATSGP